MILKYLKLGINKKARRTFDGLFIFLKNHLFFFCCFLIFICAEFKVLPPRFD